MLPSIISTTSPITTSPIVSAVAPQITNKVKMLTPITLKELQNADSALMDRVDTKFTLTTYQLATILDNVSDIYRVLTIEDVSLQQYSTRYLDTPDLLFYQQHHNGCRQRYKVRLRTYLDSGLSFLEVKVKNNKNRTVKSRMKIPTGTAQLNEEMYTFLRTLIPIAPETLVPQLDNTFTRLTLVHRSSPERLTIDFGLRLVCHENSMDYPQLVIAEVKQPRFSRQSPFVQEMRVHRSQQRGFSKYCIGIALGRQDVKYNHFKPTMLQMAQYH